MAERYDAGIVTAYGAAVRGGYTGTYDEFCAQQAGYAQNAAAVEQAKQDAQTVAQTAQNVAASIPADYSQMSDDVSSLKDDLSESVGDLKSAIDHLVQYETEYTTIGGGSTIAEDIPFNFIKGGYYKVVISLVNSLANVKLQLRDRIVDPTVNDTVYNSGYYGEITFQAEHSGKYLRYMSTSNATITIAAVTISYNYEKEENDIDYINRHILFDETIPLIDSYVIRNNTSVVDPTLVSNANAKCCKVACNLGDTFIITGTGISNNAKLYAFTDSQYNLITNSNTTASNLQIQAPSSGYLICNFYKASAYSLIKKKSKFIDEKFDELETEVSGIEVNILPPLSGIDMFGSVGCIGDSFTVGGVRNSTDTGWLSAKNSYPKVLQNRHTIPVTNFGSSGTTTKTYNDNALPNVLADTAKDVYLICLGLNDAWNGMTIGSDDDIKSDYTLNPDTFYGNYGRIISRLMAQFPLSRFVIITPWRISGIFEPFADACIGVANHFNIPYLDCRTDSFFQSSLWEDTLVSSHPTQVTYTGMAYAVERMMEKCIVNRELYFRYAGLESV